MSLPQITDRDTWLKARRELLEAEKAHTRARDALNTRRRELPMVEVTQDYRFIGPEGEVSLGQLFGGYRQLVVNHVMFDPAWDEMCPSCSAGIREWSPGTREHLRSRDTEQVFVSRAPYAKLAAWKEKVGWSIPWYSSFGSTFNVDFGVTVDVSGETMHYNYRDAPTWEGAEGTQELPGFSAFLRVDDRVFHTYSSYARAAEWFGGSFAYLDLTALGRQEDWEEPQGRADAVRAGIPVFD
ncbi:DUF899 domain-containing protein [Actinomycetospora sp. CA-084318]|uniref:DUF899 domain-containing protein n=1 Tax=Actinomycetospora sp. CA-084318 TaxID=3239892 RepID=UPI003D950D7C